MNVFQGRGFVQHQTRVPHFLWRNANKTAAPRSAFLLLRNPLSDRDGGMAEFHLLMRSSLLFLADFPRFSIICLSGGFLGFIRGFLLFHPFS